LNFGHIGTVEATELNKKFWEEVICLLSLHKFFIWSNWTKFKVTQLCWARLTLQFWISAILKWLKLQDQKLSHRGPFEWHHLPTKFYENLPVVSKLLGGKYRQTDGLVTC
jgi:hypothetical protein